MAPAIARPTTRDLLILVACHAVGFGLAVVQPVVSPVEGVAEAAAVLLLGLALGGSLSCIALHLRDGFVERRWPRVTSFQAMGMFPAIALAMIVAAISLYPGVATILIIGFIYIQLYLTYLACVLTLGMLSRRFRRESGLSDWRSALGLWVAVTTGSSFALLALFVAWPVF